MIHDAEYYRTCSERELKIAESCPIGSGERQFHAALAKDYGIAAIEAEGQELKDGFDRMADATTKPTHRGALLLYIAGIALLIITTGIALLIITIGLYMATHGGPQ